MFCGPCIWMSVSDFWRTVETPHVGHSLLISWALPSWDLVWHGVCSYKNYVCLNKNKSSAKIPWYLCYETWKSAIPRPPWIFQFCCPFIDTFLLIAATITTLCKMFCVVWIHLRILLSKLQWSLKAFFWRRASIRMLLRLCKVVIFEILAPELLALNSSFPFIKRP